jgi:hypothetical protein
MAHLAQGLSAVEDGVWICGAGVWTAPSPIRGRCQSKAMIKLAMVHLLVKRIA